MNRLMRWLDDVVERLCNWLNDAVPGRHRLALVGNGLAGVYGGAPLPLDRRRGPEILQMHANQYDMADRSHAKGEYSGLRPGTNINVKYTITNHNCGYWAYCHMSGEPCVRCGGNNALLPGNQYRLDLKKA